MLGPHIMDNKSSEYGVIKQNIFALNIQFPLVNYTFTPNVSTFPGLIVHDERTKYGREACKLLYLHVISGRGNILLPLVTLVT